MYVQRGPRGHHLPMHMHMHAVRSCFCVCCLLLLLLLFVTLACACSTSAFSSAGAKLHVFHQIEQKRFWPAPIHQTFRGLYAVPSHQHAPRKKGGQINPEPWRACVNVHYRPIARRCRRQKDTAQCVSKPPSVNRPTETCCQDLIGDARASRPCLIHIAHRRFCRAASPASYAT